MRCFFGLFFALLAACSSPPPRPVAEPIGFAPGEGYHIDAARSAVRIHVFRAGRAANLGHNHVLTAPTLAGVISLPNVSDAPDLAGARFELALRLADLELDPPALRAALGANWASTMSPEAIAATRANMLGEGNLQAERFPALRIRSIQIVGEWPKLVTEVEISLHGQQRSQWLALHAELAGGTISARGALVLRQSDFGIAPFSVLGGLLAVRDELLVEFELVATNTAQTSPSKGSTSTTSPAVRSP